MLILLIFTVIIIYSNILIIAFFLLKFLDEFYLREVYRLREVFKRVYLRKNITQKHHPINTPPKIYLQNTSLTSSRYIFRGNFKMNAQNANIFELNTKGCLNLLETNFYYNRKIDYDMIYNLITRENRIYIPDKANA